jgi:hypothetical protein
MSWLRALADRASFRLACVIGYPFLAIDGLHEMRAER